MTEMGAPLLVFAVLALAVAVAVLALSVFRLARGRDRDILDVLRRHNDNVTRLLDREEGRRAVAQLVLNEGALLGFVTEIEDAAREAEDPARAAMQAAEEETTSEGWAKRGWRKLKSLGKPVAETVFGKINSYIKSRFGAGGSD